MVARPVMARPVVARRRLRTGAGTRSRPRSTLRTGADISPAAAATAASTAPADDGGS